MPTPIELARAELRANRPSDFLCGFLRVIVEGGLLPMGELMYFLARPEKWAPELAAWRAAGEPADPDAAGWDAFAASFEG